MEVSITTAFFYNKWVIANECSEFFTGGCSDYRSGDFDWSPTAKSLKHLTFFLYLQNYPAKNFYFRGFVMYSIPELMT